MGGGGQAAWSHGRRGIQARRARAGVRKLISDAFQEHHDTLADDDMQFDKRMQQLTAKLQDQFTESAKLDKAILKNLASLGFTGKEYP